jgi:hypothetical protein
MSLKAYAARRVTGSDDDDDAKATFTRDGIFNHHNFHRWAQNNPTETVEKKTVNVKINVLCRVIGEKVF